MICPIEFFNPHLLTRCKLNLLLLCFVGLGLFCSGEMTWPALAQETTDRSNYSSAYNLSEPSPGQKLRNPTITDSLISDETTKRVVEKLKIHVKNGKARIRIHPSTMAITVLGPNLAPLDADTLRNAVYAYIDAENLSPGIYVRPARIILPKNFVMTDATPEVFIVEVRGKNNINP